MCLCSDGILTVFTFVCKCEANHLKLVRRYRQYLHSLYQSIPPQLFCGQTYGKIQYNSVKSLTTNNKGLILPVKMKPTSPTFTVLKLLMPNEGQFHEEAQEWSAAKRHVWACRLATSTGLGLSLDHQMAANLRRVYQAHDKKLERNTRRSSALRHL